MQVKLLVFGGEKTEPEVNNLDIVVLIDHDIVKLNITMRYLFTMQVLDSGNDPSEDLFGLLLRNPLLAWTLNTGKVKSYQCIPLQVRPICRCLSWCTALLY